MSNDRQDQRHDQGVAPSQESLGDRPFNDSTQTGLMLDMAGLWDDGDDPGRTVALGISGEADGPLGAIVSPGRAGLFGGLLVP